MVLCKQGNEEDCSLAQKDKIRSKFSSVRFDYWDVVWIVASILGFIAGVCFTAVVACFHYFDGHYWYCWMTVAFQVIPSLTMTLFSAFWYVQDDRKYSFKPSTLRRTIRIVALVLQMGPVLRYVDCMLYGLKSRTTTGDARISYIQKTIYEENDAATLLLFEAMLGNAPQLVLQIYILLKNYPHPDREFWLDFFNVDIVEEVQLMFILISLMLLAESLTYYHRSLRVCLPEKKNITCVGSLCQLLYHYLLIASRVLCLGLLAYLSPVALFVFCFLHWSLMTGWIIWMKTDFCETRLQELLYNAALGVAYIFCYLNAVDMPTRFRYILYHSCTFLENAGIVITWYYFCEQSLLWFRSAAIIIHYSTFSIGILVMVMYYLFLHPNGRSQLLATTLTIQKERKHDTLRDDTGGTALVAIKATKKNEATNGNMEIISSA